MWMRMDVYLQRMGLIKHRTEAKLACEHGSVKVGGVAVKPSRPVREGQRITIAYPRRVLEVEVLGIPEGSVRRSERHRYYRVVGERLRDWEG